MKQITEPSPGIESTSTRRRSLLALLWGALGLVAVCEIVWLVVAFLRPRKQSAATDGAGNIMAAGPVDAFETATVTAFPRGRFYLARLADGGFLALSRRCTHLGCTVPWSEKDNRFLCPCHGSAFDIRGEVLQSPAPRALDRYQVLIENGVVMVDTGKSLSRSRFETSQVVYP